jgi:hypothetical protein
VFVTWSIETLRPTYPLSILAHQLRRRFRSDNSLLRGARPTYLTTWPEGSLVFRSVRPAFETRIRRSLFPAKPSDFPRPFLEQLLLRPALLTKFRRTREPRRARDICLFRRLLPGWPRQEPEGSSHCLPAEIGPLVTAASSCRCRPSDEAGTAVPITHAPCASHPSRGSEKCGTKPVDNGDFGNNNWIDADSTLGCRSVLVSLPHRSA